MTLSQNITALQACDQTDFIPLRVDNNLPSAHIKRSMAHDQDVLAQQIPHNSHVFLIYEFRTHLEQFGS